MTKARKISWIGSIFIVIGLVQIGMVAVSTWNWYRARSWIPTRATVIAVDVNTTSSGPKSRSRSTSLSAEYQYELNDTLIHADGISPFSSIEPFASYKRKIASELRTAKARGETVICFVNGDSSDEAYLKREIRLGAVIIVPLSGLLFLGAGVWIARHQARNTGEIE